MFLSLDEFGTPDTDLESIHDQALFVKSVYNLGLSADDWIPGTNPISRLLDMANPPLINLF
jgi:hypothetical protein